MSKSSRLSSGLTCPPVTGNFTSAHSRCSVVCMRMIGERKPQSRLARTLWPGAGRAAPSAGTCTIVVLSAIVDRGGNGAAAAALGLQHALVTRLPARRRVEHGAVQDDAAALVHGEHLRGAVAQVGIGAVELLGHGSSWQERTSGAGRRVQ